MAPVKSRAIDMHAHALIGAAEDIAREHERWRREARARTPHSRIRRRP
jgi:hypothetical protein